MLRVAMLFIVVGGLLIGVGFLGMPKTKETPPKACWYVSAKTLNIREKPSLESAIWGVLQKNTKICEYWGVQNGFLQISRGWVAMDYLSSNPIPNPKIQEKLAFENKKIVLRSHLKEENKDSLKEAREYFANSDYRAAKNLALRANYENPKNPESWEIFTKSLYLEGKKQEAISILEKFLQTQYDENLFNADYYKLTDGIVAEIGSSCYTVASNGSMELIDDVGRIDLVTDDYVIVQNHDDTYQLTTHQELLTNTITGLSYDFVGGTYNGHKFLYDTRDKDGDGLINTNYNNYSSVETLGNSLSSGLIINYEYYNDTISICVAGSEDVLTYSYDYDTYDDVNFSAISQVNDTQTIYGLSYTYHDKTFTSYILYTLTEDAQ